MVIPALIASTYSVASGPRLAQSGSINRTYPVHTELAGGARRIIDGAALEFTFTLRGPYPVLNFRQTGAAHNLETNL